MTDPSITRAMAAQVISKATRECLDEDPTFAARAQAVTEVLQAVPGTPQTPDVLAAIHMAVGMTMFMVDVAREFAANGTTLAEMLLGAVDQ